MSSQISVINNGKKDSNTPHAHANMEQSNEEKKNETEIEKTIQELEDSLGELYQSMNYLDNNSNGVKTRLPEEVEFDELDESLEELSQNAGKIETNDDQISDIPAISRDMLRLSLKLNGGMRPATPNSKYPASVVSEADSGIGVCSSTRRQEDSPWPRMSYQFPWPTADDDVSVGRGSSGFMRANRSFNISESGRNTPTMLRNAKSLDVGTHGRFTPSVDDVSLRSITIPMGSTDGKKIIYKKESPPEDLLQLPLKSFEDNGLGPRASFQRSAAGSFDDYRRPRRAQWANKAQFFLACVGYSVGLGNIWRFPYVCYKSGGGAFIVPYIIALILCGIPILYMEISIGQFTRRGPIGAIGKLCPIFKGVGLSSVIISFIMSTYYNIIIAYSLFYFFSAFKASPPWSGCGHVWNSLACWTPPKEGDDFTIARPNSTRTSSQEFFENKLLQISSGIDDMGSLRWELAACLIVAWIMVYFSIWKSIKSSGKVLYFTATFPYVIILAFLVRSLTLEGADVGLKYLFRPKWQLLADAKIWVNAAGQVFSSLGLAFGAIVSFSSYNKRSNRILVDTLAVTVINALTSLMVAVFAFATIGNIATEHHTSVHDVITDGPGLVFVVYPQAMAKMPASQVWAVLFFFMLLCLGLNTQFSVVEVVVTCIQDGFPNWMKRHFVCHEVLVFVVCLVSFLIGIPNIFQGGIYLFQLIDHYVASLSILYLSFFEVIAIAWCYGLTRLRQNVKEMTNERISIYFRFCLLLATPAFLLSISIFSLIDYAPPTYHNGDYKYPFWAEALGWSISGLCLVCIVAFAVYSYATAEGKTIKEKLKNAAMPHQLTAAVNEDDDFNSHIFDMATTPQPVKEMETLLPAGKLPIIMPAGSHLSMSRPATPKINIPR